jgi:hypothetical protein
MGAFKNHYAQRIYDILSPLIGEFMAKGAIRNQCQKLGIHEDSIKKENLEPISSGLKKGLVIFVGPDGAMKIADSITAL